MSWLVFDIGCIECGESSRPVAIVETEDAAEALAGDYGNVSGHWGREEWHGQHSVEWFDLAAVDPLNGGTPNG